jgi:transcriptional regulator with XRE-family HTH domain
MSSTMLTFYEKCSTIQGTEHEGWAMPVRTKPNRGFANFLRRRMRLVDVEQKDLTDTFSISKGTVSRWLNGNIGAAPQMPTFVAFSAALQTPLVQLLEQAGYPIEWPTEPSDRHLRLARKLDAYPWLVERLDDLMRLSDDEFQELMEYVEFRRLGQSDDQSTA